METEIKKTEVKKSDFVLNPYMKSNDLWATYQIINTVVPYICLWFLAVKAAEFSLWLLPPIMVMMTLFSLRCFSLMHDCGHYSLFTSKKANRIVGFCLGSINAIPQYPWSRGHAYHHKTNGDWERYRGVGAFLSTEEFGKLSSFDQSVYELTRHPLMPFPGGFFYLAIKPRLALILGLYGLTKHFFACQKQNPGMKFAQIFATYESRNWYSEAEFWDLLFNNIAVISIWVFLSHLLGAGFFLGIYSITLTCSAAVFMYVFFVQHNYEGSYAHKTAGWDYLTAAIEGSSYLELPTFFKWFSADIGYHNIHHLSERIPNYHLEACHRANSHLLVKSKKLRMSDMVGCFKFILWDASSSSLVSVDSYRQTELFKSQVTFESQSI
jgi:acyl-lipid omega-6 desaturase (Delta-12 desaturase)